MKIIGLTGGSGSGKGAVSKILAKLNIPSIDTDLVYRELTASRGPCLSALAEEFGEQIIAEDGTLDRRRLSALVFSGEGSGERLARLNEIAHAYILAETERQLQDLAARGFDLAVVDAPVLFESGFDKSCDTVIAVIADREIRVRRITERDGITVDMAERRIDSQLSDAELRARCEYVIVNDSDIDALEDGVIEIVSKIRTKYNLKGDK